MNEKCSKFWDSKFWDNRFWVSFNTVMNRVPPIPYWARMTIMAISCALSITSIMLSAGVFAR